MTSDDPKILIIGGGSRIASALAPLLGNQVCMVSRSPTGVANELLVGDYGDVPDSFFSNVHCVVNCVGTNVGSTSALARVNFEIPIRLASAARKAGVYRFIQVSSFSVYGAVSQIDRSTPTLPDCAYGRSKLAADEALLALTTESFAPVLLRLPLIYAPKSMGKLGQLLRFWVKFHLIPVPMKDIKRAMIGAELTAEVIARLCKDSRQGIVHAADPVAFSYALAAAARRETLFRLPLPGIAGKFITRIAPQFGRRLFGDSELAESDNLAIEFGLQTRIYEDIAAADLCNMVTK